MKKKRIILGVLALLATIALCAFTQSGRDGALIGGNEEIKTIQYRGHSYICYRFSQKVYKGGMGGASLVHDPDCKCQKPTPAKKTGK